MRLGKNSKVLTDAINVTQRYIEPKYSSENLNEESSLLLIKFTHKADNNYNNEWSTFQNFEQFGNLIVNSKKSPILEFVYRWSDEFQTIPNIQSLMNDNKNVSKENYSKSRSLLISVIARPLLSILQETFWKGLMESYFKFFHPIRTLFSLVDFDPKSAPESLLSAIYFAGFITSPSRPEELISYMHSYAIVHIKKILFRVNLSSAQALGIYSFAFYLNGDSKLSRVCLSHLARMNHALGLTINRKNLPLLDQYNRKIIINYMRLYYSWTMLGPSSYELTCEIEENGLDIYDPKYQYPNSILNLYNNEYLSTIYSIFCTQCAKLINFHTAINLEFCKYESKKIKKEIESLSIKAKKIFNDAKVTLESLSDLVPEYKCETSIYLKMIKAPYILTNLSINSKILELSEYRNLGKVKDIVDNCIDGWELFSNNSSLNELYSWGPYIVAFHLIQVYPYCSKNQKNIVIFILKSII